MRQDANTVFIKIDEGIYFVEKDRFGNYSGRYYVNTNEVIDALNSRPNVMIWAKNELGIMSALHRNF
jgi:hypothetical protein